MDRIIGIMSVESDISHYFTHYTLIIYLLLIKYSEMSNDTILHLLLFDICIGGINLINSKRFTHDPCRVALSSAIKYFFRQVQL